MVFLYFFVAPAPLKLADIKEYRKDKYVLDGHHHQILSCLNDSSKHKESSIPDQCQQNE